MFVNQTIVSAAPRAPFIAEAFSKSLHHRCYKFVGVFDCPAWLVDETSLYFDPLRPELTHLRLGKQGDRFRSNGRSIQGFRLVIFHKPWFFELLWPAVLRQIGRRKLFIYGLKLTPQI